MPTLKSLPVALCLLLFSPVWGHALSEAALLRVHLEGDRLSLEARDHLLSDILEKLSQAGIRIRIDPRINPAVTASFSNRPIAVALPSILKSVNYVLIWRKAPSAADSQARLMEVQIFYKGQEERMRPLRSSSNLVVVERADGVYHVQDMLLVRPAPDMTEVALAVLLDRLGATVVDADRSLGILRLQLPYGSDVGAIAETVADMAGIENVAPDFAYPLIGGVALAGRSAALPLSGLRGPVTGQPLVAVMDSGLLADYGNHPLVRAAFDAVTPGAEVGDALGHGTQMMLVATGAVTPLGADADAPDGSPVVAIRAFDDNGFTSDFTLMRGIDYAIEQGARVISLSWGSESSSPLLESAMRHAAAKGLIVVAAAGNTPSGNPVYPAAYAGVIGVGALNPGGDAWESSNFGDFVALSAPGQADLPVGFNGDPGVYAGTSIATAYVARRVAAILSRHPDADRDLILRLLADDNPN